MTHTLLRIASLALLLAILATTIIAYHTTANYPAPRHATCVRVDRAYVGEMAVEIEGAC